MTSRPLSLRRRLGTSAVVVAVATVTFAGSSVANARLSYAGEPALVAPRAAAPPAAAIGKLTASTPGCTITAATTSDPETMACDLWAKPGTTQLLGQNIPIWGYSTTEGGAATAPGPVIVAKQGDRVTLTLHNGLAEATALALPGQAAGDFSGGLANDGPSAGVAPGESTTYTFTASRAGTFLYEAGHTAGGPRQVAMGLAGALVVLSSDGTAYGQTYDDESVLVLSEVDPAFNAKPATFDMRSFNPTFRLINGKPFPSTDPVPTEQDHSVLLRYVNVGSQLHAMSVLGGDQQVLSHDAHALGSPETSVVAAVDPGVTMDAIVRMPTGPEAKVAVYESAGQLDNGGMTTADPLSVAFGGMLTFLDTNAPRPSLDSVGPASTGVKATPNPADGTGDVTVTATVSDSRSGGSNVVQAELVVDDDVASVAPGFGIQMDVPAPDVSVSVTGTIPARATPAQCETTPSLVDLHCLSSAKHSIYVRGKDAAENWGVVGSVILNLAKTGPQTVSGTVSPSPTNGKAAVTLTATGDDTAAGGTVTAAEYFLGALGTSGNGRPMTLNRSASLVAESASIPASDVLALGEGTATVYVHSQNSQGIWGPVLEVPLPVDLTAPAVNASSVGPNPNNGTLSAKAYPGYVVVSAEVEDRDAGGAAQSNVVLAEAFLDPGATPTFGKGITLTAVDGAFDSSKEQAYGLIPLTQIKALSSGEHAVYVHAKDAAGNWGSLSANNALVRLYIDKTAPVLGTLTGSPNPTNGSSVVTLTAPVTETNAPTYTGPRFQAAEYWLGTTDPGVGKATRVSVADGGSTVSSTIALDTLVIGQYRFNLRVQDAAGNWSNAVYTTVNVTRPNAVFSDTFNSGNLNAWSAQTGSVSATLAAGIPLGSGNYGMAASLLGGSGNAPAYVTDTSPVVETTYHAQFSFNPNTLSTGTGSGTWVTLFEGQTAASAQAFAIQYHRVGTGTPQLRIVMARSGTTPVTGSAVNLSAGAHVVRIDWRQGPATGNTAGRTVLTVDGTVRDTRTGANNTTDLLLDSVRLGVTAGTSTTAAGMAGTAWFDAFTSTRFTLP